MVAPVHSESCSHDALPVCLWRENPNGLVSLWDLLNRFDAFAFGNFLLRLKAMQHEVEQQRRETGGDTPLNEKHRAEINALLFGTRNFDGAYQLCSNLSTSKPLGSAPSAPSKLPFAKVLAALPMIEQYLQRDATVSRMCSEVEQLTQAIIAEFHEMCFLFVAPDRHHYVDNEALFGERVRGAFPKAIPDIREAGNCLAAECNTAAVFHLMRVAEHGLRALARDRRVELAKKAVLDLATWEAILKDLEDAEIAIQGYAKTLAREAQFDFYHGAMMEFKRFKNKFRNRIMHTRGEYDRDQAHSALIHVRAFMGILASRISETKRTPKIWKGKKWVTEPL